MFKTAMYWDKYLWADICLKQLNYICRFPLVRILITVQKWLSTTAVLHIAGPIPEKKNLKLIKMNSDLYILLDGTSFSTARRAKISML